MDSLIATLNDSSSERAQQQLEALRAALETRLTTLEAVLDDPTRGESLEGLILDLARVATEEARAVAVKAALDARIEADARVEHARTVAQEAIDQERVVGGELRRTIEQARQRITSLENGQLTQLRSLREDLESEIARERATAANFERSATETARHLDVERAAGAELRRALDAERAAAADMGLALEQERATSTDLRAAVEAEQRASADVRRLLEAEQAAAAELNLTAERTQALSTNLVREKAEAWAAQDALAFDLARERDRATKLQGLNDELQRELDRVRSAAEATRVGMEADDLSRERERTAESQRRTEELQRELDTARSEMDALRTGLEAAGGRLEMLDSERLRADGARKELEARVDALTHERDAITADLQAARQVKLPSAEVTVAATEPASTAPLPREVAAASAPVAAVVPVAPVAPVAPVTPAAPKARAGEEDWGPVRLAVRFAFRQPIPIQINGDAGLLVDLSVAGCQLVSSSSVRPNQVVKVLLPAEETTLVCSGKVMWARFEPRAAGGSIGYRAGVHFTKPDQAALEAFISSSRTPPPH